jgi:two-component system sensor histidine kinase KdpD
MTDGQEDHRPSPEAMLRAARAEETGDGRGKLKIFLGYAAGVGKTFAMLEEARLRKREGRDVAVGYVESHGRTETDALLEGLEIIPCAGIEYHGVSLPEMDVDAVLARRPRIALVDELAHTNAPGSRHAKRSQDVEELLAAGIDVYTTVNVQHLESLNEIVAQITGVVVRETVPDRLLDEAAEIRLVDIPWEDLLERLREGKVYVPEQAAWAADKFFKPGNLMALRELSLRRTASRVDDEMRAYMESRAISGPWAATERLLVCVSGSPYSEQLIRATRRLADDMKAQWFTVHIETPGSDRFMRENRERVWRELRLAESLGAQVATVTAPAVTEAIIDYAARHNITKIVVGKSLLSRWRELLHPSIIDQLIRRCKGIDVYVVSIAPQKTGDKITRVRRGGEKISWRGYMASAALVALATGCGELLRPFLAPTNMVMIYLLAVVVAAVRLGLKPAISTAFMGVLAFDFFFIPPRHSLSVADTEYLVTFIALFTVGVVISTLVDKARERGDTIREREVQTASLYYLSRDLSAAADIQGVLHAVISNMKESLNARPAILLPEGQRLEVKAAGGGLSLDAREYAVADWAFRNRQPAGRGTETLGSAELFHLPLKTSAGALGVMAVKLENDSDYSSPLVRRLLDAFASQATLAIERVHLVRQAEQAQVLQARENLERALLNSVSHDLRTPLVSITGALSALKSEERLLDEKNRRELLDAAWEEAARLNRFVGNLLDITRIEAGAVRLKKEPCDIQDMIGCALAAVEQRPGARRVELHIADGLPFVMMDMALMTQVMVNLLDNAMKYSPLGGAISIAARMDDNALRLEVADGGPGVPKADLKRIFDKFYRIPVPEGTGGTGLGLSICKGIVEAHGGAITAENRSQGGLRIIVTLPVVGSGP